MKLKMGDFMVMTQKIKETISTNKILLATLIIILIIMLIFYCKVFFTKGVYFDDVFLKKEVISSDTHYIGKTNAGNIHITVKGVNDKQGDVDVIYSLPNNINEKYTVVFKDSNDLKSRSFHIKDESGEIVFEGEYNKNRLFLLDKKGKPVIEGYNTRWNGEVTYDSNYKILFKDVVEFAMMSNETIRGNFHFLVGSILVFILTFIDIKYPLFFFTLNNFLSVKNPEPSDFYLIMQRLSWYISPIIGIILMLGAIC